MCLRRFNYFLVVQFRDMHAPNTKRHTTQMYYVSSPNRYFMIDIRVHVR